VKAVPVIAGYALREAVRRKIFLVVLLLSLVFLALYWLGTRQAFRDTQHFVGVVPVDAHVLTGATVLGLAMFGTLFLGTVLAVFLTLGVVRGDAERGLLQPLVVRPLGRSTLLVARFAGAVFVCVPYVVALYAASVVITGALGGWWPDRIVLPALELSAAVTLVVGLSLLGSVFLSSTANGIAIFMIFGAGLVAGLLGQIGQALGSHTLEHVARVASWVLPFEALYQDGLNQLTAHTTGFTNYALQLGPFGGSQVGGGWLAPWAAAYLMIVGAAALVGFARRDL
jgi:ABC-type transport system involved in multi-copper enzyme maturation permease subunit